MARDGGKKTTVLRRFKKTFKKIIDCISIHVLRVF